MTRDGKQMLAVVAVLAAAAAAGVLACGGGVLRFSTQLDAATDEAGWAPDYYGPAYQHLCQPGDMRHRLHARHPLFTRPAQVGGHRAAVVSNGWGWFADPPSEEGI